MILFIITAACGPARQNEKKEADTEEEPMVYTAIELEASSLAPNMMHLAHLHGFEDGSEASCPPVPEADHNGDGIVDLIETRDYSGITMIPFHDNPVGLEIKTHTYPKADAQGRFNYSTVVSVQGLSSAVQEKFGVEDFNFGDFVVYVHGVGEQTTLPESVQSLPDVPAMVTLPVTCGELE